MTIKDLIEDSGERLGIKQITTGISGLMKEVKCTKIQIINNSKGLLNNLIPQIPLILKPSRLFQFGSSTAAMRNKIFQFINSCGIPYLSLSNSIEIPHYLVDFSLKNNLPVFSSIYDEYLLESRMIGILREKISKIVTICGVLVNCDGVGVLIRGESGIGKTECAVRLVDRGHIWIADDSVEIEKRDGNLLYGRAHKLIRNLLEIKQLGIVNAVNLFGARSIRHETVVDIILNFNRAINLVKTDNAVISKKMHDIMGVRLPLLKISVPYDISGLTDYVESSVREYLKERVVK